MTKMETYGGILWNIAGCGLSNSPTALSPYRGWTSDYEASEKVGETKY